MSINIYPMKVSNAFFKNYIYLISDTASKTAALIDPVWMKKEIYHLLEAEELSLSTILLTHSHPDHTHLAEQLARETGCSVFMSDPEITCYGFSCYNLQPLNHQDSIPLGDSEILALLTPGHTRGSMCYQVKNNLFSGDTLFIEGCGLCWGKGADPSAMFHSLQWLKQTLPLNIKIFPAHSFGYEPGQTFEFVLKNNIYLDFKEEDSFIKYRMRKNQRLLFAFK